MLRGMRDTFGQQLHTRPVSGRLRPVGIASRWATATNASHAERVGRLAALHATTDEPAAVVVTFPGP